MGKIRTFFSNRWVGFILTSIVYIAWFVLWTGNWWLLLGEILIVDLFFTKLTYRFIGRRNEAWCRRSAAYKFVYEWINAILFATVVASLIHIFFFQMYVIPSSSMEGSLLVGDYLYVSKVAYGPQMPNTPVAFPFVHHTMPFSKTRKSFSECVKWPYHRLKGLGEIRRNDVVVFNFPAGDTVLLERQNETYYDILREYRQRYGSKAGRERLFSDYTVLSRPVDKRENYIKRCVALPGDKLQIVGGVVYVNDSIQASIPGKQYLYQLRTTSPLPPSVFETAGISEWNGKDTNYQVLTTEERAEWLQRLSNVVAVDRYIAELPTQDVFPHDATLRWNMDNYGPIVIPERGATVTLTLENLPLYRRIIEQYEGNRLEERDGRIYINGEATDSYTFRMNYYWMMGDNRHNSADSRFWGFVPEDHIVGKASFVWLSLDPDKSFPSNIRWNRMFRKVR